MPGNGEFGEEGRKKSRNQPECYPPQPLNPPPEHTELANSIQPTQGTLSAAADAATDELSSARVEMLRTGCYGCSEHAQHSNIVITGFSYEGTEGG